MKALTFSTFGTADVLEYLEVANPVLQPGDILVSTKAIGLNFADVYRRKGTYHLKGKPPYIAGYEGAGIVVNNNGHATIKVGDRVAFADVPFANAALVAVPVTHAIPLPEEVSFETAAAILLQGMTAQYLATDSHPVTKGETVLIHAAAGGVGQLLIQICKLRGAKVIGLTSAVNKKECALAIGADTVFLYQENWKKQVLDHTDQQGVDVTYDSVGATLQDSFEVTKSRGQVVFYGTSGGKPAPVDPTMLMDTSKTLTGGDLWSYLTTREERIKRSAELFHWIKTAAIRLSPPTSFPLSQGKQAHEFLESRKSMGKIILIP